MIRKGARVEYIGENPLAKGYIFDVMHKWHDNVIVMFPCKTCGGGVHLYETMIPIKDVVEVKKS